MWLTVPFGPQEVSLLASARGSSSSSLPSVPLQPITRVPLPGAHPPLPLTHKPPPTAAGGSSAPRASHADGAASGGGSGQKAVALQLKAAMPSAVLLPTGALASAHLPTFSPVKSRTVDGTTEAAGKKRAGGGGGASAGTGKSFADDQSLIEEARVEGAGVMPEEGVEREGCGGDAREEELAMLREEVRPPRVSLIGTPAFFSAWVLCSPNFVIREKVAAARGKMPCLPNREPL